MAKKGYPGLVLVPPSDRKILRRRLLHWVLFLIALIWGASALPLWPPASNDTANCPPGVGDQASGKSPEQCGQLQSATEPPPNQSQLNLTPVSQAEGLAELQNPTPSPTSPDSDRLEAQNNQGQDAKRKSSGPVTPPADHNVAASDTEKSVSRLPAPKPVKNPNVDARLAERGDAFAQYRLGRYYARRDGSRTPEAVSWYKKALPGLHRLAETGNGEAMYVLGVMYAYGRGVAPDAQQAQRWLGQAVERNITAAQPVLASLHVQPSADHHSKVNEAAKR
jgi:hypothetical protein